MILMIDNYDSFTYNVVQYLGELGAQVSVYRNDAITLDAIAERAPSKIVISPGPCTPNEAGISMAVVSRFGPTIPILGICLGHQSLGQALGGKVIRAAQVMHGKTSLIHHNAQGVFAELPNPFEATRYHSLVVDKDTLPDCLEITAWTEQGGQVDEIMGLRHVSWPLQGVQFHPESIRTTVGHDLLRNFLESGVVG
jgi:anthranilate synthase component 2